MARLRHGRDCQRVPIHIRIVRQHCDRDGRVLVGRSAVVARHRAASFTAFTVIVDRGDVGVRSAVVGLEGEPVRAVVVRRRRVGERPVELSVTDPVRWAGDQEEGQRVAVDIGRRDVAIERACPRWC